MVQLLQKILSVLITQRIGPAVETVASRFNDDMSFNFMEMGKKNGCRNVTIYNSGDFELILLDVKQYILPGQSFTIIGSERVVNKQFRVAFGKLKTIGAINPRKDAIIRYNIDVCD